MNNAGQCEASRIIGAYLYKIGWFSVYVGMDGIIKRKGPFETQEQANGHLAKIMLDK